MSAELPGKRFVYLISVMQQHVFALCNPSNVMRWAHPGRVVSL